MKYDPANLIFSTDPKQSEFPEFWEEVKEPEFKPGDWVYIKDDGFTYDGNIQGSIKRIKEFSTTFNGYNGIVFNNFYDEKPCGYLSGSKTLNDYLKLATFQDIKSHLIAEAKKRNININAVVNREKLVSVTHMRHPERMALNSTEYGYLDSPEWDYERDIDTLYCNDWIVYCKGIWAEVIEEPIKIGAYIANFSDNYITFGCKRYAKHEVTQLYDTCLIFGIQQILLHGHKVEFTVIKQIYNKLTKG